MSTPGTTAPGTQGPTPRAAGSGEARAELEEERAFLLRSLVDLDRERAAGDIDEEDYARLKDEYTARAAEVLRALGADRATAPAAARPRRRRWRTAAVVAGVLLFGAVAGELLARASGERVAGEPSSGSIRRTTSGTLGRAHDLFREGELLEALKLFDEVLEDDPDNAEALAYRGWIVHLAGLTDRGLASIDEAIAADPRYPFARFFKGLILLQARNDPAAAIPELEAFLANDPPAAMVAPARAILAEARAAAARGGATTAPDGENPPPRAGDPAS